MPAFSISEEEVETAEELRCVFVRCDVLAVEILRDSEDVLERNPAHAELDTLLAVIHAIAIRGPRSCVLAELAVSDISAPRTLVCVLCALVVILEAVGVVEVVRLRVLRVLRLEEAVLVKAVACLQRPDIRLVVRVVEVAIIVSFRQCILVERAVEMASWICG